MQGKAIPGLPALLQQCSGQATIGCEEAVTNGFNPACKIQGKVYLVLKNKILTTIDKKTEAVPALFATFYVFHVNFTVGAVSVFQFLEFLFFTSKVPKKPRLTRFIAKLKL